MFFLSLSLSFLTQVNYLKGFAKIKYFLQPCCSNISTSEAELRTLCEVRRVYLGLYNVIRAKTQPTAPEFSVPRVTLDRGVLLPAPVLSRMGALFCSSPLPLPLSATSILSPKFCLKLELLKRLTGFHRHLSVVGSTCDTVLSLIK